MEITSINNELVKNSSKLLQKKYRNDSGKFLLEGYKAIKEGFDYGLKFEYIFVDKSHLKDYDFGKDKIIETNSVVLKKISSTESAPPAVGIAYQVNYNKKDFKNFNKIILLEEIRDLGNLGTIIRSAVAFGADGIVLYGDCADIYNPKCVRAAVGNLWKIPIINIEKFEELQELFADFSRIATLPLTNNYLSDFKVRDKMLVMFGSEADGLSGELVDFSTESLKIEMNENVESLNLSASASVVMYKLFK